ncbi:hypothetical protein BCR34DRAFT_582713 [Clohesyomyces aquaticus]|uniref:Uncharacterized protein n=1 Tax=Clohesyomyces aquaticus TaxID=1231657 RepID=A0A1Y2A900_9PLEO|nr:hypothetical protein BCR34DRAFT_582713 [Clohesyomyces aquaticus]
MEGQIRNATSTQTGDQSTEAETAPGTQRRGSPAGSRVRNTHEAARSIANTHRVGRRALAAEQTTPASLTAGARPGSELALAPTPAPTTAPSAAALPPEHEDTLRLRTCSERPKTNLTKPYSDQTAPLPSYQARACSPAPARSRSTAAPPGPLRMMLSTISHSMSPSFPQSCEHLPSPTMSLAILPQRQAPARQPTTTTTTTAAADAASPRPRLPRLQINTQQVRTFGKGSTSLRLDTLSAVSPTQRNTYSNAYEAVPASAAPILAVPAPGRPSKPRLSINSSFPTTANPQTSTPSSASTLSSSTLTSASSSESATISIPYKQPHNVTSILTNSPARPFLPRKMAPVRPLFPAEKKVAFRTPLEEEIKNVKYTMAHSDLESSVSSESTLSSVESTTSTRSDPSTKSLSLSVGSAASSSDAPSSPSVPSPSNGSTSSIFSSLEGSPRPKGPRLGDKRDSSESESDSDTVPETPVAGRRKRSRDWRWTLGPLDKSSSTKSDTTTSDDSS